MGKLNLKELYKSFSENLLSYLHLVEDEFIEITEYVNTLKNIKPFILDVRESTSVQKSLNLTVIISYTRCFTNNYGFYNTKEVNDILISEFTNGELDLHKKIKKMRNQQFAHSDASAHDIQIYDEGFYTHSMKVVRENLEIDELELLSNMIHKIRNQIDIQIKDIEPL
ncbi:MAG: hypothetical protein KDC90_12740 [Ignavibacteriae bacterium]|nr:hypothetical protein [Ignavibacteriota bacterium]MCB9211503.1 hypothetical protein [Ignavibacteriales bacterium]